MMRGATDPIRSLAQSEITECELQGHTETCRPQLSTVRCRGSQYVRIASKIGIQPALRSQVIVRSSAMSQCASNVLHTPNL